ncbi:hypothetical protein ACFHW0_27235 [Micromonospora sp. LOL_025]|uniref:hypothetical protein n=1 Tax=Micromonospora sp. LOL_025 TaxID=3345413 RepID=UPI003A88A07E
MPGAAHNVGTTAPTRVADAVRALLDRPGLPTSPTDRWTPLRIGNTEIRPLGGGVGCLLMIIFSVLASIVLTVLVNTVLRAFT